MNEKEETQSDIPFEDFDTFKVVRSKNKDFFDVYGVKKKSGSHWIIGSQIPETAIFRLFCLYKFVPETYRCFMDEDEKEKNESRRVREGL